MVNRAAALMPLFFMHMCVGMAAEICAEDSEKSQHIMLNYDAQLKLFKASSSLNKELIDVALQTGAHLNLGDCYGFTPLHNAVIAPGNSEQRNAVVEHLIARGAKQHANLYGLTPVHYALWRGHDEIVTRFAGYSVECSAQALLGLFYRYWHSLGAAADGEKLAFPGFVARECGNAPLLMDYFLDEQNMYYTDDIGRVPIICAAMADDEEQALRAVTILAFMQPSRFKPEDIKTINILACIEAIKKHHRNVMKFFFKKQRVAYDTCDESTGSNWLHYCVRAGAQDCFWYIVDKTDKLLLKKMDKCGKTPAVMYCEKWGVPPSSPIGSPRAKADSSSNSPVVKRGRRGSFTKLGSKLKESFHSKSQPNLRANTTQPSKLTNSTEGVKEDTKKGGI